MRRGQGGQKKREKKRKKEKKKHGKRRMSYSCFPQAVFWHDLTLSGLSLNVRLREHAPFLTPRLLPLRRGSLSAPFIHPHGCNAKEKTPWMAGQKEHSWLVRWPGTGDKRQAMPETSSVRTFGFSDDEARRIPFSCGREGARRRRRGRRKYVVMHTTYAVAPTTSMARDGPLPNTGVSCG